MTDQYGAGEAWHNNSKRVRMEYGFNSETNAEHQCIYFKVNSDGSLSSNGYYPDCTLQVTKTFDEDNKLLYEFKDDNGKVVLTRQKNGIVWYDTYYVYDDFGLLRYSLPPAFIEAGTVNEDLIKKYAYIYTYDKRKRCIKKQLPGGVLVYYIYDKADRLRMSQDGNQREKGEWTYYKYDVFGRMVLSGIYKQSVGENISYDTMSSRVNNNTTLCESYTTTSGRDQYTFSSYPNEIYKTTTLIANYYDNYDYQSYLPSLFNTCKTYVSGVSDPEWSSAVGQLTGSKVALLDNSGTFLWTSTRYGKNALPVQNISMNSLGGLEKTFYRYSFTGQVIEKRMEHTTTSTTPSFTEVYTYEYDHADRLEKTYYNYGARNISPPLMSELIYNDLGQLSEKLLYDQHNNRVLETIRYFYNVRGWLTEISSDSFKEKLHYTPEGGMTTGLYNGNIYAQTVSFPSTSSLIRGYKFGYDGLKRLTTAAYGEGSLLSSNTTRYSESIRYDKNGNITSHTNRGKIPGSVGTYSSLQDLVKIYDGNRLKKVTNNSAYSSFYGSQFFQDGANLATEYIYDANGNMTQDFNKGIALVKYNFLNLPEVVQMNNGHSVKYTYDALGRKHKQEIITLKSTVNVNMGEILPISTDQIKSHRNVHYCGNVIYSGLTKLLMKQIMTDEGYISYEGYHTHVLKDHLGNVRAELDDFGVQVTKNYYPYGIEYESGIWNSDFAYASKELQSSHGLNWYDFGKRSLDIGLGLWPTMDPLCENHPSISPYAYCGGDPVNRFDPDGLVWYYHVESKQFMWKEGSDHMDGYDWIGPEHKEDLGNGSYIAYYQNVGILTEKNKSALEVLDENEILQTRLLGRNSPLSEDSKTFLNNRANNRVLSELGREVGLMVTMELAGMGAGKIIGQIEKWAWVLFGKGAVKGGFNSFSAFKKTIGAAGEGKAWHHVVEQTPANISKFGNQTIHNVNNLIKLSHGVGSIHARVSGYYSSIQPFTNGQTVRKWLSTQSYQKQYDFGFQVLENFGWTP